MTEHTLEELEAIGQKLSDWVESDAYLDTLDGAQFQPRTPEGAAQAEAIYQAAISQQSDQPPRR